MPGDEAKPDRFTFNDQPVLEAVASALSPLEDGQKGEESDEESFAREEFQEEGAASLGFFPQIFISHSGICVRFAIVRWCRVRTGTAVQRPYINSFDVSLLGRGDL